MKIKVDLKIFLLILCYILTNKIKAFSIIFIFMILHEIAHLIAGIILGLKVKKVNFTIAGFTIEFLEADADNYIIKSKKRLKNKILIDLGGPFVNLIFVILALILNLPEIMYANLIIFLINIFPILPLDGGRILRNILMYKYTFKTVNNVMIEISKINLIVLTVISSVIVVYLKNYAVAIFVIYLWILFIKEKHTSNMIKKMYKVISEKALDLKNQ